MGAGDLARPCVGDRRIDQRFVDGRSEHLGNETLRPVRFGLDGRDRHGRRRCLYVAVAPAAVPADAAKPLRVIDGYAGARGEFRRCRRGTACRGCGDPARARSSSSGSYYGGRSWFGRSNSGSNSSNIGRTTSGTGVAFAPSSSPSELFPPPPPPPSSSTTDDVAWWSGRRVRRIRRVAERRHAAHSCEERVDWLEQAEATGFTFHTIDNAPYWDERAYYAFSLKEIEQDIEAPTAELDAMCRELVRARDRGRAPDARAAHPREILELHRGELEARRLSVSMVVSISAMTDAARRSCSNTMPIRRPRSSRPVCFNGCGWSRRNAAHHAEGCRPVQFAA